MPELPEVETVRIGLERYLVGHSVTDLAVLRDRSFQSEIALANQFLIGAKVCSVKRRAKLLIINLDSDYSLLVHLKMTGQLVYRSDSGQRFGAGHPSDSLIERLPDKSTRIILSLDGASLFFNDQRVFGWMKLLPTVELPQFEFIKKLGPEPLEKEFTAAVFAERLSRKQGSQIKAAILDQTVLAGVGNIYADEALWHAGLHPRMRVKELSREDISRLHQCIVSVLLLGLEKGGSTDKNYVNAEGKQGSYLDYAKVFRREGQNCFSCGTEIIKIRVAGRGTHICPQCQKI